MLLDLEGRNAIWGACHHLISALQPPPQPPPQPQPPSADPSSSGGVSGGVSSPLTARVSESGGKSSGDPGAVWLNPRPYLQTPFTRLEKNAGSP